MLKSNKCVFISCESVFWNVAFQRTFLHCCIKLLSVYDDAAWHKSTVDVFMYKVQLQKCHLNVIQTLYMFEV